MHLLPHSFWGSEWRPWVRVPPEDTVSGQPTVLHFQLILEKSPLNSPVGRPQILATWASAQGLSQHGSWLFTEKKKEVRAPRQQSQCLSLWFQKGHTMTPAIPYWSHRSDLPHVREDWQGCECQQARSLGAILEDGSHPFLLANQCTRSGEQRHESVGEQNLSPLMCL